MSDPAPYAVRLSGDAQRDIEYARDRLATYAGEEVADNWLSGFLDRLSHLASGPNHAEAEESSLFPFEVRAFPYRPAGSSVTYRILYRVKEDSPDGPQVWVLHVRHGAAAPMKPYEARNLESGLEESGGV